MNKSVTFLLTSLLVTLGLTGCDSNMQTSGAESTANAPEQSMTNQSEAATSMAATPTPLARHSCGTTRRGCRPLCIPEPEQTLNFFGIQPGMTVVEALPGGGWYSKLLLPYLGSEGELIGANYPVGMYELFGWSEERLAKVATWKTDWPATAQGWVEGDAAKSFRLCIR